MDDFNNQRTRKLNQASPGKGPIVYWMSRDQRVQDNWALIRAVSEAKKLHRDLLVVFTLASDYPGATMRSYDFMLKGLKDVETDLMQLNIPLILLNGNPVNQLQKFLKEISCSILFTDFDPLRIKRKWKEDLLENLTIPFYETDAHNIVPCFVASGKQEFGAYTFRPKMARQLLNFLVEFPVIKPMKKSTFSSSPIPWKKIVDGLNTDKTVLPVQGIIPGSRAAQIQLSKFLDMKLMNYATHRNDPNADAASGLSPYLHFGHISAQRVALDILRGIPRSASTDAFLEELIVRKELSDNYCFHNPCYDSVKGFPGWSTKEHEIHRMDEREFLYSLRNFEKGDTHDQLWNSAQIQMVKTGSMHGYMRMYWAKKILEWTSSPEEAMQFAIYLNDKYQLDGRDPNGYTGIAWSIGGLHDRAWSSRPVYGKIRYMNASGCRRKFDVDLYIQQIQKL